MATVEENNVYNPSDWKAISLTHVEYLKGDLFGYLLAWSSLLPIFIAVGFFTLIIFRRDLHTICYALGILINEAINWVLKHIIREQRPIRGRVLNTEFGLPSSHAQFMWFFSTYFVIFLIVRVHHNTHFIENIWKYATSLGSLGAACLVSLSRVYLGYHTLTQVLWGALAGSSLGVLWFLAVHFLFTPLFPVIASWPLSEYLMIRDSTLIPNVLWFEYTSHRAESRKRQRKVSSRKSL